jgi:hypothetical protein
VLVGDDPQATLLMPPPPPTDRKPIKTLVGSPTPIYNAFPTDSQPLAGSPTSPYQTQRRKTRWPLYVSLGVVLLFIVGGATALVLLFELKVSPATARQTNPNSETPNPTVARSPETSPSPSPSPYTDKDLVGSWSTRVNEQGQRMEITVTFLRDGSTRYVFKNAQGRTNYQASWRYSDGLLYERYPDGKSGKHSIRWIDKDSFELTIIDNGNPSYVGLKRLYHRITQAPL